MEVFVGAVITLLVAVVFYYLAGRDMQRDLRQAVDELKAETELLRQTTAATLRVLEQAGYNEAARDVHGNPTGGLAFKASVDDVGQGTDSADATSLRVDRRPSAAPDAR